MRSFSSMRSISATSIMVGSVFVFSAIAAIPDGYKGTPFHDDSLKTYPIKIPGKVQCEYYDFGGDSVAYGGAKGLKDGINYGAHLNGPLEQGCGEGYPYICTFRAKEKVGVSYTKTCCDIDAGLNKFPQILKEMYIGWTPPGQWTNYTVHVDTTGVYTINFLYTAPFPEGLEFSLSINNTIAVNKAKVPCGRKGGSALPPADINAWHRWDKIINLAEVTFPDTGLQLLTLRLTYPDPAQTNDLGNLDYFEFIRKGPVPALPMINRASESSFRLSAPEKVVNGSVQVSFSIPAAGQTALSVYDCTGSRVMECASEQLAAGSYSRTLDLSSLGKGVYFVKLSQGAENAISKLTICNR
jgi:hypothetical protein